MAGHFYLAGAPVAAGDAHVLGGARVDAVGTWNAAIRADIEVFRDDVAAIDEDKAPARLVLEVQTGEADVRAILKYDGARRGQATPDPSIAPSPFTTTSSIPTKFKKAAVQ